MNKILQLQGAIRGWQGLLDRNWKLYEDARAGKLTNNAVTRLVADALLQDDNGVDNVKYINGAKAPNADKLREISAIRFNSSSHVSFLNRLIYRCSFGGVGATIAFTDNFETETVDATSQTEVKSWELGLRAEMTAIVVVAGPTVSGDYAGSNEYETTKSQEKSQGKVRSRSFVLGDADDGDYFDVQVSNICLHFSEFF